MAEFGQWTGFSLEVARTQVVENQATFVEMAGGEGFFDALLLWQQPVHGGVEVVFAGVFLDAAFLGQSGVEGFVAQSPGGGQFGAGKQNACVNHGHAEVSLGAGFRAEQKVQPEFAYGGENGERVILKG